MTCCGTEARMAVEAACSVVADSVKAGRILNSIPMLPRISSAARWHRSRQSDLGDRMRESLLERAESPLQRHLMAGKIKIQQDIPEKYCRRSAAQRYRKCDHD